MKDVGDQKAGVTEGRVTWGRGAGSFVSLKGAEILKGRAAG